MTFAHLAIVVSDEKLLRLSVKQRIVLCTCWL